MRPHLLTLAIALLAPSIASSQLPLATEASLLGRVLAYDDRVARHGPGDITVLVLHATDDTSTAAALRRAARLEGTEILPGRFLRVQVATYRGPAGLADLLRDSRAAAVFVPADLCVQAGEMAQVLRRAASSLSFADDPSCLGGGLSIALLGGDGPARILVNRLASLEEGALLDAGLLGLADVWQGAGP